MHYKKLGSSELNISTLCLGSMTWGHQNTEAEGHAQIDRALDAGINCIDTAELYPVLPLKSETQGDTESIIGTWFEKTGRRDEVVLMSKVAGINASTVRQDGSPITPTTMRNAIEGSLKRLKTEYIDLYQTHWPNRGHYHFRRIWDYHPEVNSKEQVEDEILAILETAAELIHEGKMRYLGLSNETAWGVMKFCEIAEKHNLPRIISTQNEYSVLYRAHEPDLQEVSHFENVDLLTYSTLAGGLLSGKYKGGTVMPEGSRRSREAAVGGRVTETSWKAVAAYTDLAQEHGLDPSAMALAYARTRPFTGSVIIGATSMEQLEINLSAGELELGDEVLQGIEAIRKTYPMPY